MQGSKHVRSNLGAIALPESFVLVSLWPLGIEDWNWTLCSSCGQCYETVIGLIVRDVVSRVNWKFTSCDCSDLDFGQRDVKAGNHTQRSENRPPGSVSNFIE